MDTALVAINRRSLSIFGQSRLGSSGGGGGATLERRGRRGVARVCADRRAVTPRPRQNVRQRAGDVTEYFPVASRGERMAEVDVLDDWYPNKWHEPRLRKYLLVRQSNKDSKILLRFKYFKIRVSLQIY